MKKVLLVMSVAFMFLVVSCNKDQSAVKKLDGTWKATKMSTSGSGFSFDFIAMGGSATMTFDGCKLKKDEWCKVTSTMTFDGATDTENDLYRVVGDGTKLETKDSDTSSTVGVMVITELTKKVCKLTQTEDGFTTTIELEKQK